MNKPCWENQSEIGQHCKRQLTDQVTEIIVHKKNNFDVTGILVWSHTCPLVIKSGDRWHWVLNHHWLGRQNGFLKGLVLTIELLVLLSKKEFLSDKSKLWKKTKDNFIDCFVPPVSILQAIAFHGAVKTKGAFTAHCLLEDY